MNEELVEWLARRSLDATRLNTAFGLYRSTKNGRLTIRYRTTLGVERVRFIDGEHPKYEWQKRGGVPHWYGLKQALDLETSGPLYVVNGEPSVWAAWQSGVAAVCTCGGEGSLPADSLLEHLASLGRQIRIVYDADRTGEAGSIRLAQALLEFGADVQVRRWREFLEGHQAAADVPIDDLTGFDVDDLHQLVGDEELGSALEDLEILSVERADKPEPRRTSHYHLGDVVLRRLQYRDGPDVVWDVGSFWRYERAIGVWRPISENEINREIGGLDGFVFTDGEKVKTLSLSAGAIESIRRCAVMQASTEDGFFDGAARGVQFRNGFLDERMKLRPSSADLRQQLFIDAVYDADADCPLFLDAMQAQFWGEHDAADRNAMLQEFAGAVLMGMTGRVLFLSGDGGNGKSFVIDVLSRLVPDEARCSIAPHKLSAGHQAEYWVAQLAGRRLNVDADIPAGEMLESSEFKKSVTGDELMGRDPAGKPFKFRPRILHLYSANELPGTRDHSKGFWRRVLVLSFDRDFEADPDSGVSGDLAILRASTPREEFGAEIWRREREGILAWAVEGARRLLANAGQYTVPPSSSQIKDDWRRSSDQVAVFLEEECNADVDYWTTSADLHQHYNDWARRTNHGQLSSTKFGTRMRTLGFTERADRKRRSSRGYEYRVARLAQVDSSEYGQEGMW